jgi:hypothetical protein
MSSNREVFGPFMEKGISPERLHTNTTLDHIQQHFRVTNAGSPHSKGGYCAKKESQLREGIKPTC